MNIDIKTYCEKIRGCFLGKNIGGTLGAPFEGKRGVLDIDYYTHDLSMGVLPNDDLDLQLVWLIAAERYGRAVNAEILAQYWLTYIVADWVEYGNGKNNLRAGLPIGESNRHENSFMNSCGCFIRSEIWACLAPGRPDIAVKYAFEDGIIDHADEGLYGEIFMAAAESAAFVIKDIRKLIEIALSYIPKQSDTAKAILLAIECYDKGLTWKEARKKILESFPSGFGLYNLGSYVTEYVTPKDDDIREDCNCWGYDAPANVAITVMAAIYGEGDFSKAVCIATGCLEDADCTAGSVGAIYGIMFGPECIDEKWLAPIGDEIKTVSIDRTKKSEYVNRFPTTVSELTDRIIRLMPSFMNEDYNPATGVIEVTDPRTAAAKRFKSAYTKDKIVTDEEFIERLFEDDSTSNLYHKLTSTEKRVLRNSGIIKSNCLVEAIMVPDDGYEIKAETEKTFTMYFENIHVNQQWLNIKIGFPEEWESHSKEVSLFLYENYPNRYDTVKVSFIPKNLTKNRYDIPVSISVVGRNIELNTKIVFFVK